MHLHLRHGTRRCVSVLGGNWFSNGVAAEVAKTHRAIAIDGRGHGRSDKPHDPKNLTAIMAGYIPREYIDTFARFIRENDPE